MELKQLRLAAWAAALLFSAATAQADIVASSNIILSGLNAPREVVVARNGDIYVAEAGTSVTEGQAIANIITDTNHIGYINNTGRITKLSGGVSSVFASGISSIYNSTTGEITGLQGLDIYYGGNGVTPSLIYGSIGMGASLSNRNASGYTDLNVLKAFDTAGNVSATVQLAAGTLVPAGSNAFHMSLYNGIDHLYADAGANAVFVYDGINGVHKKVGDLPLTTTSPNAQFVPTVALYDTDSGLIFVGGLGGFPFVPDSSSIYTLELNGSPDQTPDVFATGFTHILDMEFAPDGSIYVLEYDSDGIFTGPGNPGGLGVNGALWRLSADGLSREQILFGDALIQPTGMDVGADGTIYIVNNTNGAGNGQLLAITIPEPGAGALAALAALGALALRRRRRA